MFDLDIESTVSKAIDPETGEPLASALNEIAPETRISRTPLANANFSVGAQITLQNSIMKQLNDLWRSSANVGWWDKTVGT